MSKIQLSKINPAKTIIANEPILLTDVGYITSNNFLPFGKIFINEYNGMLTDINKSAIQNEGTLIKEKHFGNLYKFSIEQLTDFIKKRIISKEIWIQVQSENKILPFTIGISGEKPYLKFLGIISELAVYDMLMIKKHNIPLNICKFCGKAFTPVKGSKQCSDCSKDGKEANREKYERIKQDPKRKKYTNLRSRISKREGESSNYLNLFLRLYQNNKHLKWLNLWDTLDKNYQQIKKQALKNNTYIEIEWDKQVGNQNFKTIEELESWLYQQNKILP